MHHGTLNITVTSPVQTFDEPLTLSELKTYLNVPDLSPPDTENDDLIEALIAGAREQAEILQGRDLVEKQYDLTLERWSPEIELRDPLISVDLVQYTDSDGIETPLVEDTDFIVDTAKHPGVIMPAPGKSWPSFTPWPTSPILVRFTCGAGEVSELVKTGMKLLISHWYNGRLPFEAGGGAIQEYPYAVTTLLSQGGIPRAG